MAGQSRGNRVQAAIDLLDRPLILAGLDREAFARIVRCEAELQDWFHYYPGWHIERTRDMVRLIRQPAALRPQLGLPGLRGQLDYLLLALVLHLAEVGAARGGDAGSTGNRFLLSLLADEVATLVRSRYGTTAFDLADLNHRRALVRVMQALDGLGAVVRLDGSAHEWAERAASADGLYAFTEVAGSLAVARPTQPTVVAAAVPLTTATAVGGAAPLAAPAAASLALPVDRLIDVEQRAWRALLLGPALFAIDDEPALAALTARRVSYARDIAEYFGWRLDVRQGMARIVRDSRAQDAPGVMLSPRYRSEYGPVLLLCGAMQDMVGRGEVTPAPDGGVRISYSRLTDILLTQRATHRALYAGGLGECSGQQLLERVTALMQENGMLRGPDALGDIWLSPLCALYRGSFRTDEPTPEEDQPDGQLQLFA